MPMTSHPLEAISPEASTQRPLSPDDERVLREAYKQYLDIGALHFPPVQPGEIIYTERKRCSEIAVDGIPAPAVADGTGPQGPLKVETAPPARVITPLVRERVDAPTEEQITAALRWLSSQGEDLNINTFARKHHIKTIITLANRGLIDIVIVTVSKQESEGEQKIPEILVGINSKGESLIASSPLKATT